jgi:hypothetical protein
MSPARRANRPPRGVRRHEAASSSGKAKRASAGKSAKPRDGKPQGGKPARAKTSAAITPRPKQATVIGGDDFPSKSAKTNKPRSKPRGKKH